jgi:hypothetical protein
MGIGTAAACAVASVADVFAVTHFNESNRLTSVLCVLAADAGEVGAAPELVTRTLPLPGSPQDQPHHRSEGRLCHSVRLAQALRRAVVRAPFWGGRFDRFGLVS